MLNFTPFEVFGLRFSSNQYLLEAVKHVSLFDPKWRHMTSPNHHFLKNFSTDSPEILVNVNLMSDNVL